MCERVTLLLSTVKVCHVLSGFIRVCLVVKNWGMRNNKITESHRQQFWSVLVFFFLHLLLLVAGVKGYREEGGVKRA